MSIVGIYSCIFVCPTTSSSTTSYDNDGDESSHFTAPSGVVFVSSSFLEAVWPRTLWIRRRRRSRKTHVPSHARSGRAVCVCKGRTPELPSRLFVDHRVRLAASTIHWPWAKRIHVRTDRTSNPHGSGGRGRPNCVVPYEKKQNSRAFRIVDDHVVPSRQRDGLLPPVQVMEHI